MQQAAKPSRHPPPLLPSLLHPQVLHVEQEVVGDDTPVLQAVLACDTERTELLKVGRGGAGPTPRGPSRGGWGPAPPEPR